jgi:hypothetical protein
MGHIEKARVPTGRQVLLHDARRVLHGHFPTSEFNQSSAEARVTIVQHGPQQLCHGFLLTMGTPAPADGSPSVRAFNPETAMGVNRFLPLDFPPELS